MGTVWQEFPVAPIGQCEFPEKAKVRRDQTKWGKMSPTESLDGVSPCS
jgi:hypothetical protein